MRSQPQAAVQAVHKCYDDFFPINIEEYQLGKLGDPTIYLSDLWVQEFGEMYEGYLIKATHNDTNIEYFYKAKEYKDGWWKLEWPD